MNYYAYVVVTKNEFKYTTNAKKAVLVLSVEGYNGVVRTLSDLGNAIDVTDNAGNTFKGFDITEFSGVITLTDNLYRIIGVFGDNYHGIKDQQLVKVIKNTTYGNLAWNTPKSNDWASASLNTTLNSTFKTEKISGFDDRIAEVTCRVSRCNTSDATAKIGLMYPSDYGYATTPDYWTTGLNEYYHATAYGVIATCAVRPSFYLLSSVNFAGG